MRLRQSQPHALRLPHVCYSCEVIEKVISITRYTDNVAFRTDNYYHFYHNRLQHVPVTNELPVTTLQLEGSQLYIGCPMPPRHRGSVPDPMSPRHRGSVPDAWRLTPTVKRRRRAGWLERAPEETSGTNSVSPRWEMWVTRHVHRTY